MLEHLEAEARDAKRGLWVHPHLVLPWERRKQPQGGEEELGPARFHPAQFAISPLRDAQDRRILGVESRLPFKGMMENR